MNGTVELDEIGLSYFAALCEGLMLINEHESPTRPAKLDSPELVRFVQVRGKQIHAAFVMTRWNDQEVEQVAVETRRIFPEEKHLTAFNFAEGQKVLPQDRRYPGRFSYSVIKRLQSSGNGNGTEKKPTPTPRATRQLAQPPPPSAPPAIANAENFAETLSDQIADTVIGMSIRALELAAEKLRARQ